MLRPNRFGLVFAKSFILRPSCTEQISLRFALQKLGAGGRGVPGVDPRVTCGGCWFLEMFGWPVLLAASIGIWFLGRLRLGICSGVSRIRKEKWQSN